MLSVSHGMGIPSISILLHEVTKLMHHARARGFCYLRVGTCGGLGVDPGTVVISDKCVNEKVGPPPPSGARAARRSAVTAAPRLRAWRPPGRGVRRSVVPGSMQAQPRAV